MRRYECNLPHVIRSYGFSYADTLDYGAQIAKGMLFLHQNRIVHRNLKITNILVPSPPPLPARPNGMTHTRAPDPQAKRKSEEENKWRVLISDIDLYKEADLVPLPADVNQTHVKAYLPPEVPISPRSAHHAFSPSGKNQPSFPHHIYIYIYIYIWLGFTDATQESVQPQRRHVGIWLDTFGDGHRVWFLFVWAQLSHHSLSVACSFFPLGVMRTKRMPTHHTQSNQPRLTARL